MGDAAPRPQTNRKPAALGGPRGGQSGGQGVGAVAGRLRVFAVGVKASGEKDGLRLEPPHGR